MMRWLVPMGVGLAAAIGLASPVSAKAATSEIVASANEVCRSGRPAETGEQADEFLARADRLLASLDLDPSTEEFKERVGQVYAAKPDGLLCAALIYFDYFDQASTLDSAWAYFLKATTISDGIGSLPLYAHHEIAWLTHDASQSRALDMDLAKAAGQVSLAMSAHLLPGPQEFYRSKTLIQFHRCTDYLLKFKSYRDSELDACLRMTVAAAEEAKTIDSPHLKKAIERAGPAWFALTRAVEGSPFEKPEAERGRFGKELIYDSRGGLPGLWRALAQAPDADAISQKDRRSLAAVDVKIALLIAFNDPSLKPELQADLTAAARIAREAGWDEAAEILTLE